VIIATFTQLDDLAARQHKPRIVLVDPHNRARQRDAKEIAGPERRMQP